LLQETELLSPACPKECFIVKEALIFDFIFFDRNTDFFFLLLNYFVFQVSAKYKVVSVGLRKSWRSRLNYMSNYGIPAF